MSVKTLDREVTEGLARSEDRVEIVAIENVGMVLEDVQPKLVR
jgi:hypothetical protein